MRQIELSALIRLRLENLPARPPLASRPMAISKRETLAGQGTDHRTQLIVSTKKHGRRFVVDRV